MKDHQLRNASYEKSILLIVLILSCLFFLLTFKTKTVNAQIVYVDQNQLESGGGETWEEALKTITGGIIRARELGYQEIRVAGGIYAERVTLEPGLSLYGGFSGEDLTLSERDFHQNETVIRAGSNGSAVIGADGAKVDGFTICYGRAIRGGGILCEQDNPFESYRITVQNCIIAHNEASMGDGGGIYSRNYTLAVRNCRIQENSAPNGCGGGIYCLRTSGSIRNNEIKSNTSDKAGAGIYCRFTSSDFEIRNNFVAGNRSNNGSGAGLYMTNASDSWIVNNMVVENIAMKSGAGIYLSNGAPFLINNTIAANISIATTAYDLVSSYAYPTIVNCIIWCNLPCKKALTAQGYPIIDISYSNVSNFVEGIGNISRDPKFRAGYYLHADSNCIDAGNPESSDNDRDGTGNDMGAYGGPHAGKAGCDYDPPVINILTGPIYLEAENADGTVAQFMPIEILPDNTLRIHCNGFLMADLLDDDRFPPYWDLKDSKGNSIKANGALLGLGKTLLTIQAADGYGNVAKQDVDIIVQDTIAPEARGKDITVQLNAGGQTNIAAADVDDGSFDACGIAGMSVSPDGFDCGAIGPNPVTLTVTDLNGNVDVCEVNVLVEDTVPPEARGKDITIKLDAGGQANIAAADVDDGSFDACGLAGMCVSPDSFDCGARGPNPVTLTVTDLNGNIDVCEVNVLVTDNLAPIPDETELSEERGECQVTVAQAPTATDNCAGIIPGTTTDPLTYTKQGIYTITWAYDDEQGNVTQQTQPVVVSDTNAPIVDAGPDQKVKAGAKVTLKTNASDSCDAELDFIWTEGEKTLSTEASFTHKFSVGTHELLLTVKDDSGNEGKDSVTIKVKSNSNDYISQLYFPLNYFPSNQLNQQLFNHQTWRNYPYYQQSLLPTYQPPWMGYQLKWLTHQPPWMGYQLPWPTYQPPWSGYPLSLTYQP